MATDPKDKVVTLGLLHEYDKLRITGDDPNPGLDLYSMVRDNHDDMSTIEDRLLQYLDETSLVHGWTTSSNPSVIAGAGATNSDISIRYHYGHAFSVSGYIKAASGSVTLKPIAGSSTYGLSTGIKVISEQDFQEATGGDMRSLSWYLPVYLISGGGQYMYGLGTTVVSVDIYGELFLCAGQSAASYPSTTSGQVLSTMYTGAPIFIRNRPSVAKYGAPVTLSEERMLTCDAMGDEVLERLNPDFQEA